MKRSWCGRDDGERAPRAAARRTIRRNRPFGCSRPAGRGKKKPARGRLSSRQWRPYLAWLTIQSTTVLISASVAVEPPRGGIAPLPLMTLADQRVGALGEARRPGGLVADLRRAGDARRVADLAGLRCRAAGVAPAAAWVVAGAAAATWRGVAAGAAARRRCRRCRAARRRSSRRAAARRAGGRGGRLRELGAALVGDVDHGAGDLEVAEVAAALRRHLALAGERRVEQVRRSRP